MAAELASKALAIAIPNVASFAGCCCASGGCSLSGCGKAADADCKPPCPVPSQAWHAVVAMANSSTGYASYLVWKELRGFGSHEHSAFACYLLSNAVHPCLLRKCSSWGCGPAIVNAVVGVGLAVGVTHMFMKVDGRASHFMIPGIALSLLRAGCTFSCAAKKCCGKSCGGGKCPKSCAEGECPKSCAEGECPTKKDCGDKCC